MNIVSTIEIWGQRDYWELELSGKTARVIFLKHKSDHVISYLKSFKAALYLPFTSFLLIKLDSLACHKRPSYPVLSLTIT